jgi:hypothetical protein
MTIISCIPGAPKASIVVFTGQNYAGVAFYAMGIYRVCRLVRVAESRDLCFPGKIGAKWRIRERKSHLNIPSIRNFHLDSRLIG